jgi:hypothetical protein
LIFNDLDKANEFNNFFAMQTDLDDSEAVLPELSLPENQLCDIEISETDVEDVLSILNQIQVYLDTHRGFFLLEM